MGKTTTTELIDAIAKEGGETKTAVKAMMARIFGEIADQLAAGNAVSIYGFGTFRPRHNAARKGRNPRTTEDMDIAASTSATFKQAKALKDALN
jgi:DNA-binding protein HU-beta